MQISLDEFSTRFPGRGQPVPQEYAGQWVAWNEQCTEILSHGNDMREVRDRVIAAGCARPVMQKIPRGPFVGGA
jgi:hypothetical protein